MTSHQTPTIPPSLPDALGGVAVRCLTGIASPADVAALNEWRSTSPGHEAEWSAWICAWQLAGSDTNQKVWNVEAALTQVRVARDHVDDRVPSTAGKNNLRTWTLRRGVDSLGSRTLRKWIGAGIAAIVAVLVIATGLPHMSGFPGMTRTYATRTGEQATVILGDSTRVTLAPRTTLRLERFGAHSRTVVLDGEAFFETARVSGVPFVVRSGSVVTRVLGTAFVVRNYPEETRTRVAVTSGKVDVSSTNGRFAPVQLTAGRLSDISDSVVSVRTGDAAADESRWTQGELVFQDAPVREVLATLNRWFGYQFRSPDTTVMHRNVTIAVSTRSSAVTFSILEQVLDVNLTVVGDTVTLIPRPAQPAHGQTRIHTYDVWTPHKEIGR